jgi:hypothetical protein
MDCDENPANGCEGRAGFVDCDGVRANGCEAELSTDALNCGACGRSCATGRRCVDGACQL